MGWGLDWRRDPTSLLKMLTPCSGHGEPKGGDLRAQRGEDHLHQGLPPQEAPLELSGAWPWGTGRFWVRELDGRGRQTDGQATWGQAPVAPAPGPSGANAEPG